MIFSRFEVVTDDKGRIEGYTQPRKDELLPPEKINEYVDGEEFLLYEGEEYALDKSGNLIHRSIDMPPTLKLGSGVLLGSGIQFGYQLIEVRWAGLVEPARRELGPEPIVIEDRVVAKNLDGRPRGIHEGAHIGHHTVLLATSVGSNTVIGPHTTVGPQCDISTDVTIGSNVQLGEKVWLCSGVSIGNNVKIHDNNQVYPGITIGSDSEIDAPGGKLDMDIPPKVYLSK